MPQQESPSSLDVRLVLLLDVRSFQKSVIHTKLRPRVAWPSPRLSSGGGGNVEVSGDGDGLKLRGEGSSQLVTP